jgi:hypothetical protein
MDNVKDLNNTTHKIVDFEPKYEFNKSYTNGTGETKWEKNGKKRE